MALKPEDTVGPARREIRVKNRTISRRQAVTALALGTHAIAATRPAIASDAAASCAGDPGGGRDVPQAVVRRGYLEGAYGQVHYRFAGRAARARPLLMLHPSPLSSEVFELFMREMGRDRIVVAPDTPGYGLSDPPPGPPQIADYATSMHALTRKLGWDPFDVFGYHTGSNTAVEMAHQQPGRIRHVVLNGASIYSEEELAAARRQYAPRPVGDRPALLAARWPTFHDQAWRMLCGDARALNILLESHRNADRSQWGFLASQAYPLSARLAEVSQPTLVLCPEDDLWDLTRRAHRLLRNGRVVEFPGWTHGYLDSRATEVGSLLRDFLDA